MASLVHSADQLLTPSPSVVVGADLRQGAAGCTAECSRGSERNTRRPWAAHTVAQTSPAPGLVAQLHYLLAALPLQTEPGLESVSVQARSAVEAGRRTGLDASHAWSGHIAVESSTGCLSQRLSTTRDMPK